ncbi:hypothetical protein BBO99_00002691 [Phytophthora kernoviae]|uniref:Uncharacterized protein n=2 Tax=Phytophthora kernoviae TaxID=325452 RepID=A0A3R7JWV4_9STRA|nr:hypothetical protein G195_003838 [Phytophthora kernoviae 00238/432]RLN36641.1 hypothetical protein BBI17_002670 [Phytophthora kernoviae]RLN82745.1 hypothetical protein BBO99_00002691 [Phytophthora kernoviae]
MSPSSPSLQRQIKSPGSSHKHKRRSRSQSEGVTSDCGTAVSTTDSQLPRGSGVSCSSPRGMGVGHLSPEPLDPTEEEELSNKSSRSQDSTTDSSSIKKTSEHALDQAQRIREAEKILLEIAKEYAAKRAAGLVPTKPVPARTLLWEEMERRAQRVHYGIGRRGTCMFGRDSEDGPHHLDKLLGAIAKYRAMGMSEDEIEAKIREDFPPTERLSYGPRPTRASR